jgi:hypothetical protein
MAEVVIPRISLQDVSKFVNYNKKLAAEVAAGFGLPRRLLSSGAVAVRTQEAAEQFFEAHEPAER